MPNGGLAGDLYFQTDVGVWWANISGTWTTAGDITISNLSGSGVNIFHPDYDSDPAVGIPLASAATATPSIETVAVDGKGPNLIKITATGADAWVHLSNGVADYNVPIDPNKQWLVSLFVHGSLASMPVQTFLRSNDAGAFNLAISANTSATANTWTRISGKAFLSNDPSDAVSLRVDNDNGSGDLHIANVMIEEYLGDGTIVTPSVWAKAGLINRGNLSTKDTADFNVDVTGGTKPADNATKNSVTSGATDPTGGADGDLYFQTTSGSWWANIAGTWNKASDLTGSNTAMDVVGQGNLATQNTADFTTDVSGGTKPADNATKNEVTSGAVDPTGGLAGDLYFQTTSGSWWANVGGTWNKASDLTGSNTAKDILGQGNLATLNENQIDALNLINAATAAGATRNSVTTGTVDPTGGLDGDLFYQSVSNSWWTKLAGVWTKVSDETASNTALNIAGQGDLALLNENQINALNLINGPADANATAGSTAGTDLRDEFSNVLGDLDILNDRMAAKALMALNFNPTMSISKTTADRPEGWYVYTGTAPTYFDAARTQMRSIGANPVISALIRVSSGTTYTITAKMKAATAAISVDIRAEELNSDPGDGIYAVGFATGGDPEIALRDSLITLATASVTTAFQVFEATYTPSAAARWASISLFVTSGASDIVTDWLVVRDDATNNDDALAGTVLKSAVVLEQSAGGQNRKISLGVAKGEASDGDSFTFANAWSTPPIIHMGAGGITFDVDTLGTAPTTQQYQVNIPTAITTSGFTASCRLKTMGATPINETDGDGVGTENAWGSGHGNPDWRAGKEDPNEADNSTYTFQFDYMVGTALPGQEPVDGQIQLGFYTFDGVGWVQRGTITDFNSSTVSTKIVNNAIKVITQVGLTTQADVAGDTYGMHVEFVISNSTLDNVDNVTWSWSTSPGDISSTPVNTSKVQFEVVGNTETI